MAAALDNFVPVLPLELVEFFHHLFVDIRIQKLGPRPCPATVAIAEPPSE